MTIKMLAPLSWRRLQGSCESKNILSFQKDGCTNVSRLLRKWLQESPKCMIRSITEAFLKLSAFREILKMFYNTCSPKATGFPDFGFIMDFGIRSRPHSGRLICIAAITLSLPRSKKKNNVEEKRVIHDRGGTAALGKLASWQEIIDLICFRCILCSNSTFTVLLNASTRKSSLSFIKSAHSFPLAVRYNKFSKQVGLYNRGSSKFPFCTQLVVDFNILLHFSKFVNTSLLLRAFGSKIIVVCFCWHSNSMSVSRATVYWPVIQVIFEIVLWWLLWFTVVWCYTIFLPAQIAYKRKNKVFGVNEDLSLKYKLTFEQINLDSWYCTKTIKQRSAKLLVVLSSES